MAIIPDEKVAEVRERASILEVVGDYISLRRSGANYLGLCPFHGEKSPSFNVNPARGIFHCFGCGVGGNVVTFVMRMEGISFPEAVKLLAKRVGVVIEDRPLTAGEKRRLDEREELRRVVAAAVSYYRKVLEKEEAGQPGRNYLERRGVTPEAVAAYRLGYATDRWDGLVRHLEHLRISLDLAEQVGLVRRRSSGSGWYDLFRSRLIFTIANHQGEPIALAGRVLDDALPKYINSPESPIYHKGEVLFGIDLAKQAMREEGAALIVEGYFDHLALWQAGVRNVLATCGTAMTSGHLQLLRRYAERVQLLFDADGAGKKATFRAMELLLGEQVPAFVVELAAGEDPDSFLVKEGREAFADRLAKARPVLDYFIRDLLAGADTGSVAGKVAVVEQLTPLVQKIGNQMERELYVKEIARLLGMDPRSLLRQMQVGRAASPAFQRSAGQNQSVPPATPPEETLLALMGRYPEVVEMVRQRGVEFLFPPSMVSLAHRLMEQEADVGTFLSEVESPELRQRLGALFMDDAHLIEIDPARTFADLCRAIERRQLKKQDAKALMLELARLDPDSPRGKEILQTLDALRNRKSQLS
ncbi:DNA primase [Geobacter argillaceus]|uniref:DNA primase n=1 Tax=Geobacter argillaceus TaxID=345631 RepID=A0A562WS72_9BACT|nr:DNA primase [Geobacter argillaceus]TWJ33333.1 DNA primase [Geobacter argillaceus]